MIKAVPNKMTHNPYYITGGSHAWCTTPPGAPCHYQSTPQMLYGRHQVASRQPRPPLPPTHTTRASGGKIHNIPQLFSSYVTWATWKKTPREGCPLVRASPQSRGIGRQNSKKTDFIGTICHKQREGRLEEEHHPIVQ